MSCPEAEYIVSSVGTTTCRDGYEYITTLDECEAASNKLDTAGWNGEALDGHQDRLPYCWIGRAGKGNFNSGGKSGDKHAKSKLICKALQTTSVLLLDISQMSPSKPLPPQCPWRLVFLSGLFF